jgi:hypothetical protein
MNYVQCLLFNYRICDDVIKTVAWIPENFANLHKVIKLKRDDGTWSDGWHVKEIYSMHTEDFVKYHERDFTRQREASDI